MSKNEETIETLTKRNEDIIKEAKDLQVKYIEQGKQLEAEKTKNGTLEKSDQSVILSEKLEESEKKVKDLENLITDNNSKANTQIDKLRKKIQDLIVELSKGSGKKSVAEKPKPSKPGVYQRQSRKNESAETSERNQ